MAHFDTESTLDHNQNPSPENISLWEASSVGDLPRVTLQLKNGATPNYYHKPEEQKSAIHVAAENGHQNIVKELIAHGALLNTNVGTTFDSALTLAAHGNHLEVAKVLLGSGAHINHPNCYGNTAMHIAALNNYLDMMELLLQHSALPTLANHKGSTPLHFLCYYTGPTANDTSQQAELLIEKLISQYSVAVDAHDTRKVTPLLSCCVSARLDLAKVLIRLGADIKAKDITGQVTIAVS